MYLIEKATLTYDLVTALSTIEKGLISIAEVEKEIFGGLHAATDVTENLLMGIRRHCNSLLEEIVDRRQEIR